MFAGRAVSMLCALIVLALPVAGSEAESIGRQASSEELRSIAEQARLHAFGATAVGGRISAQSHLCAPLVISCGQTRAFEITNHDCVTDSNVYFDVIFFAAQAGQRITANASSSEFDTILALFDPDVELVASDDDSGPGLNSRIVYDIDRTSSEWVLAVLPFSSFTFGDYVLSLACSGTGGSVPAAPSGLQAVALSATEIRLSWQDNSGNETSFRVEQLVGASWAEIGSVGTNVTTVTVTDLPPATTQLFRVRARNSSGSSGYSNEASATTSGGGPTAPCTPSSTVLCIDGSPGDRRFRVNVDFATSQGGGASGGAQAIPLASLGADDGGLFTFFGASNPEMLLKILPGCSVNGRWWVFYAATTNVGFQVNVTDTQTGALWSRSNLDLQVAAPVQDTSAFACP